jgi:hypothetical protein
MRTLESAQTRFTGKERGCHIEAETNLGKPLLEGLWQLTFELPRLPAHSIDESHEHRSEHTLLDILKGLIEDEMSEVKRCV